MAQSLDQAGRMEVVWLKVCKKFCPHCKGEDCLECGKDAFSGPEYFDTLDALTKVNVRIGRLAQRVRLHVFFGDSDCIALPLLVRTLVERPDLAEHLRVVRVGDWDSDQKCVLGELTEQGVEDLRAAVMPDFGGSSLMLREPFLAMPTIGDVFYCLHERRGELWLPGDDDLAKDRIANARFNVFALFSLAKHIESVAILSEWPLAVFARFPSPENMRARPKIEFVSTSTTTLLRVQLKPAVPLGHIKELLLDSNNAHLGSNKCQVDLGQTAGLLSRLPALRRLKIQGATGNLNIPAGTVGSPQQTVLQSVIPNLSTIDLSRCPMTETGLAAVVLSCSPANLKHFRFTLPKAGGRYCLGSEMQGRDITSLLREGGLSTTLHTLHIDTSDCDIFADDDHDTLCERAHPVQSLSHFSTLRHLSISADAIYFPSRYPRVLLEDEYTGADSNERLVAFLPRGLESLEITGVYAIHVDHVAELARACGDGRFPSLKRVVLKAGGVTFRAGKTPYKLPGNDWCFESFGELAEYGAQALGAGFNEGVAQLFAAAGVEYDFDEPEFFFDRFTAKWTDPGSL